MISQRYNLNYINLGFAGSARGEEEMVEYMAGLSMLAFICDYDHNAYGLELLSSTHLPMYKTIRQAHSDIPYIIITRPDYFNNPEDNDKRNEIMYNTYSYAVNNGDKKVYYIDGKTLYDGDYYHNCTKDFAHPNDLGFYRMATVIGPVIAKVLGINSDDKHDNFKSSKTNVTEFSAEQLIDLL